ncbi:hypothetical protein [Leptospira idonii]|uniref:Uncharacterized protein n=1 Tax=Leptospira idonii TaxID=1193500 RepID=A0A4R9M510_9LEPT|nr:hypothetical protein [Leptospira idonii]TGN20797.1 hypothetical protein EHS15_01810 [Leptospira idonii]
MNKVVHKLNWGEIIQDYYSGMNFRALESKYKVSVRTIQQVNRVIMEDQFKREDSLIRKNIGNLLEEIHLTKERHCGEKGLVEG